MTLQRDSSSLKLLLSDNGKLCTTCCPGDLPDPNEMPSVCGVCSVVQPLQIKLTFSNFQDANPGVCTTASGTGRWGHFPTGTAALLNGSHILNFNNSCLYRKDIAVDYDRDIFATSDCSDGASNRNSQVLRIQANGIGGGVSVSVSYFSPDQDVVFTGTIPYTGGDVCFDTSNTVNNTHIGGPCTLEGNSIDLPATGTVGVAI